MMMRAVRFAFLAAFLGACTMTPNPGPSSPSPSGSPGASGSPAARDALPPGCRAIDLRSPNGEVLDLTGAWAGTGILAGHNEVAQLRQVGDCVYGSVIGQEISMGPGQTVANLGGRIGLDFRIPFDVVLVSQGDQELFGVYSTMDVKIGLGDDGQIFLAEDREPGQSAGRCVVISYGCPDPLIWYRVDDSGAP